MRCHYEVLDVPQDADDAQIKSAYRKLALKWHPDKNLDDPDFAKEQFQALQQAYEVLSDRQERAWYDKHREQILRGANSEFEDNSLDVFQYFTTTCFKGYGDDEKGFYTVYRTVFEKIAQEDMEFMKKDEFCEIPSFGNSQSSFDQVNAFYAYWSSYSTKKSYVWLDTYNIKEVKEVAGRRAYRSAEKENNKVRQAARKERNEEVRNLVAFVRKRDKRVQAQKKIQEGRILENKKKSEELRKQRKLQRQQELNKSTQEQPEWTKFDNVKSELEEIEKNLAEQFGEESSDSELDDVNNLYCIACNKIFKTTKAFQNHESSKKHKENIELLKQQMLDEDDDLQDYEDADEVTGSDIDRDIEECLENGFASESDDLNGSEKNIKINKKKKQKSVIQLKPEEVELEHEILNGLTSDDLDFTSNNKPKKKSKKKSKTKNENSENNVKVNEEDEEQQQPQKLKKSKKDKTKTETLEDIDINHICVTCNSNFPSKNKLFDHLKKTGHGVYIPPIVKNKKKK